MKISTSVLALLFIQAIVIIGIKCENEINSLELNRMFINAQKELLKQEEAATAPDDLKHDASGNNQLDPFSFHRMHTNMMDAHQKSTPFAADVNKAASASIKVAKKLMEEKFNKGTDGIRKLSAMKAPKKFCPFENNVVCDAAYTYRTYDGSCNNLNNLWWGKTETPYKRWMEPDYSDPYKLNELRASVDGSPLPNARDIACALHTETYDIEPYLTNMFMQWGQFLNHDITNLATQKTGGPCLKCTRTEKCIPIAITNNYTCNCINRMDHNCIELARSSATYPDMECSIGRREQMNLQTAFLDASALYGTTYEMAEKLRNHKYKGFLLTQGGVHAQKNLMPADLSLKDDDCMEQTNFTRCFLAGDDRINQNPALISLQTMFLRDHNSIAGILAKINPHWDDETVFQETRRVVIAIIQHITYNEYLPILLSPKTRAKYGLIPGTGYDYFTYYDPNVDARIANEWATSAGRFGHSMIRSEYSRLDYNYKQKGTNSFLLRNTFLRSHMIYDDMQGGAESILRGLLVDPLMKVDRYFSGELTQHLFETFDDYGRPFHFDLVSINIERGRDHGIPSYTRLRDWCKLEPVRTWTDMRRYISDDVVNVFKYLYKYVDDVDSFTALVSEHKEEGSIVGPTLNCLLANQFRDMKYGDRFWYEANAYPGAFTPGQLNEIRKVSLSKLLCRNMVDTPFIQPSAFISSKLNYSNPRVHCSQLPGINFELWRSSK